MSTRLHYTSLAAIADAGLSPRDIDGVVHDLDSDPRLRKNVKHSVDVVIDRRGQPWASFVDACLNQCSKQGPGNSGNEGVLGTIVGGPKLR